MSGKCLGRSALTSADDKLGEAELKWLLCSKELYCRWLLEKYSLTRHVLSESPAVCAYMYMLKLSPACSGEVGIEMNTPPLLDTPVGADSPLPTVAVCNAASHQEGRGST